MKEATVTRGGQEREPLVPTIALPKGGGAIQSIGEKFQTNAVTGTGAFSVPIAVSPGRAGFGPQLALAYDSGSGNSPFGLGWSAGVPSISRKTQKGLPRYQDEIESDTFLLAGAEDLVPALRADLSRDVVTDETYTMRGSERHVVYRYRPRIEGLFARIERWVRTSDGDSHWRVITGDNVTTIYGSTAASRIHDGPRTFEWLVDRSYDDKGNIVVYDYKAEDDAGIDSRQPQEYGRLRDRHAFAQKYAKRIRYGNSRPYLIHRPEFAAAAWERENQWYFEVVFDYGDHALGTPDESGTWPVRRDPFSSYRAGFEVRTYRLCRRILMFHHLDEPRLVRSTELHHDTSDGLLGNPVATQLVEVVHVSHEPGRSPARAPGVRFGYSRAEISAELETISSDVIHRLPDGRRTHWLDLDGEGLSGILAQHDGGWFYQRNEGDGRFGAPALVASVPSVAITGAAGEQLVDLNGNGRLDLVVSSPGFAGAFARTADAEWKPFATFEHVPSVDWDDPQLRLVDLTGDGTPDILVTEDDCLCWYPSEAEAGYGAAQRVAKALDEERGPAVVFADQTQTIFLADMCGDGLTAIVRIRSGEVCYWPNTGYGTFGAKVTMDGAPFFADPGSFDPRRIRLGDLDGTGTSDLLYLGDDTLRYWRNQAGNGWSEEHRIAGLPRAHSLASVHVTDLLGNGTACVVWTCELPGDAGVPLRYLPLMSTGKPYLLTEVDNGLGAVTRIAYAPSTKFYLQDRRDGRPWITTLPFPVHVVDRVETYDAIGGSRFVSLHAYHHGFFDGVEREFRGFGMVEQWDTEQYAELGTAGLFPVGRNHHHEDSHVPPVHTKTWFHTGSYEEGASISRGYAAEYYAGDPEAWLLADTSLPPGLSATEQREACRALKGRTLRQEVYALDGKEEQRHPYTVAESKHHIRVVQRRTEPHAAVFYVCDCETLTYHYERNPSDPRIAHAHTLEIDAYGTVRKSAAIAYPRRRGDLPEQQRMHVTYVEAEPIHLDATPSTFRIGLPYEQRTFELRGVPRDGPWPKQELIDAIRDARTARFTDPPPAEGRDKRLLGHTRVRYYRDNLDPDDPRPFGEGDPLGLPHEQLSLVFTQDILDQVALGGRITPELLREGGYRNDVDGDPTNWWTPSGIKLFHRERAPAMFYLPIGARDPFGADSLVEYDEPRFLFPVSVTDPAGNIASAEYDYRVLAPVRLTDANGNRTEVVFDTRGLVIAAAVMGKEDETDPRAMGDDVASYRRVDADDEHGETAAVFADPRRYLQGATTFFYYDLFAWRRDRTPPVALGLAREVHVADERGPPSPIQIALSYSDGFGRTILTKVQAEDGLAPVYDPAGELVLEAGGAPLLGDTRTTGPAPGGNPSAVHGRWVGNGATVFNNKGLPVRQYEPFFDSRPDFTDADALVRIGVSPILHYDPLGRVIRTDLPDDTFSRLVFDPWQQASYDPIDTVRESDWYRDRTGDGATIAHRAAATKAAAHHDTPTRAYLDTLGRPFATVAHNRRRTGVAPAFRLVDEYIPTSTELDIEGNPLAIYDGRRCEGLTLEQAIRHRGNTVMTYAYAMGGLQLHQHSMDAGPRWTFVNIAGNPIHAWDQRDDHGDGRGHHTHVVYDRLQRPTHTRVDLPQPDGTTRTITAQRIVYGDEIDDAEARQRNLRGKPYLQFDGAGLARTASFDFKGNALETSRRLFDIRRLPGWPAVDNLRPDWSSLDGIAAAAIEATPLLEPETFASTSVYDALNRAVAVTSPDHSIHLSHFNKANLLETVSVQLRGAAEPTRFVDGVAYDAHGRRVAIAYANGVATTYAYDDRTFRLELLRSTHSGHTLQELHYTYDPVGNITEIRDEAIAPIYFRNEEVLAASEYTYDAAYRLIEATGRESAASTRLPSHLELPIGTRIPAHDRALRNFAQLYDYDPAGNILQLRHVANGGRWTRDYRYHEASNRLGATDSLDPAFPDPAGHVYAHDANGNLLSMRHLRRMDWDHTDHLARVHIADHDDVLFAYDGGRQRVRKVRIKDNRITDRIYLGAFEIYREYLIADAAPRAELQTLHVMDDSSRICMVETPTLEGGAPVSSPSPRFRFQLGNHLGSATVELDELANVITYEEYHPYGTTAYHAQNGETIRVSAKRYRYTGMERDEETGLNYHAARYYAPWLGRWCTTDPSGLAGGDNLFEFAADSPVRFHDVTGRDPEDDVPTGQRAATMSTPRAPVPGVTVTRSRRIVAAARALALATIVGDGSPAEGHQGRPSPIEPARPQSEEQRRSQETERGRRRGERSRRVEDMGDQRPPEPPERPQPQRSARTHPPVEPSPRPRTTEVRPRLTRGGGRVQGHRIAGAASIGTLLTILELGALATAVMAARSPRERVRIAGEFALQTAAGLLAVRLFGGPVTLGLSMFSIPTDSPEPQRYVRAERERQFRAAWQQHVDEVTRELLPALQQLDLALIGIERYVEDVQSGDPMLNDPGVLAGRRSRLAAQVHAARGQVVHLLGQLSRQDLPYVRQQLERDLPRRIVSDVLQ